VGWVVPDGYAIVDARNVSYAVLMLLATSAYYLSISI
jgi:hypothetical protein